MTIRHVLQSIAKYCLYCLAYCIWIESLDFVKKLGSLPGDIAYNEVQLRFHNGPIHTQELARVKKPKPQTLNGEFDDTDYVQKSGGFTPGVMLSSKSKTSIIAGVLVEKEGTQRLTVAMYCWQEELDDPSIEFG